ncbi:hypothetical protein G6F41_011717 [Rhizopus arrhizus]|nr:hypothetical protein G6F41_011717 [Rhizopus arrhizus]
MPKIILIKFKGTMEHILVNLILNRIWSILFNKPFEMNWNQHQNNNNGYNNNDYNNNTYNNNGYQRNDNNYGRQDYIGSVAFKNESNGQSNNQKYNKSINNQPHNLNALLTQSETYSPAFTHDLYAAVRPEYPPEVTTSIPYEKPSKGTRERVRRSTTKAKGKKGVPLNRRFRSVGDFKLNDDSMESSSFISLPTEILDCKMSNSFSLYGSTKPNLSGRQLFPEYWFYGAMESIPFIQNYAYSIVTEEPNLFDEECVPWKNMGVFYDDDVCLLDEKVKFSLETQAPYSCFEILRVCEAGVRLKEKFHVDRLTSYEGIPIQVWRDLCNEEVRLEGEMRPSIDYGKFLDLRYIYALKYASRKLKTWIAILFTFIGAEKLRGAFYESVDALGIRECPFINFRDETIYKKCRASCELRQCSSCLLRLRNDDMARAMIEAVDHRRLVRYYYLYENGGSRKRISLRLELENMAYIISFERWACIVRFLQYAPARSYDNVMQFFVTTPRNYNELEAFEKSFPRASMTNVHSFGMMMEFIRERTFGEIRRGMHDVAFDSPFSSVINIRAMAYKVMDFVKYFEVAFHKIKDPNFFREYGRQERSLRTIGRLHPRSYYTASEFERFEMDDFSIGCETTASIVSERIRCAELEYTLGIIAFDYKKFKFPGKRMSRSNIVYEPHGVSVTSSYVEQLPVTYRTSFGVFPSTKVSVFDYSTQAERVVEGDPEKLLLDIEKVRAYWKIAKKEFEFSDEKDFEDYLGEKSKSVAISKAVEEISTDEGWIDTLSRDCVPYKMSEDTVVFARFSKMCACKRRCTCIPRPYLMDSAINVVRSPFSVNKGPGIVSLGNKFRRSLTAAAVLYYRGRFLGMGVREDHNVFFPAHVVAKIESRNIEVIFYDIEGNILTDTMKVKIENAPMDVGVGVLKSFSRVSKRLKGKSATIKWSSITTRYMNNNSKGYYVLDAKFPSICERMLCEASDTEISRYEVDRVVNIDKDFMYGDISLNPGDSGTALFDKNGVVVGMYLGRLMYVKSDDLSVNKSKQAIGKSVFIKFSAIDKCLFLY